MVSRGTRAWKDRRLCGVTWTLGSKAARNQYESLLSGERVKECFLSLGMDWQQDKTPPCILDMMLIATTGCDNQAGFFQLRDAWFGGSGNNGHNPKARPLPSNVMQDCKAKWIKSMLDEGNRF
uniref:Uncharacterized protein n=1 Tax=Tetraselmis chuii TaxID=63592 RepID=A0A7S1SPH9_9CHLO|mmetsp:Transcript_18633/g.33237  ORF Transcript_18633/g.33237 Transcript_18633/m.33237 type:complete len:123 (+) Transcript_18633:520-888(+)